MIKDLLFSPELDLLRLCQELIHAQIRFNHLLQIRVLLLYFRFNFSLGRFRDGYFLFLEVIFVVLFFLRVDRVLDMLVYEPALVRVE